MKHSATEYKKLLSEPLNKISTNRFQEALASFGKESDLFQAQFVTESLDWQICFNLYQINPVLLIDLITKNPKLLEAPVIVNFCDQIDGEQIKILTLIIKLYQNQNFQQIIESSSKLLTSIKKSLKKYYCLDFSLFSLTIQNEDFFVNFFVKGELKFDLGNVDALIQKNQKGSISKVFYGCPWVIHGVYKADIIELLITAHLDFYGMALKHAHDIFKDNNYESLLRISVDKYKITNLPSLLEVGDVDVTFVKYYISERYLNKNAYAAVIRMLQEKWGKVSIEKIIKLAQADSFELSKDVLSDDFFHTLLLLFKYTSKYNDISLLQKCDINYLEIDLERFKKLIAANRYMQEYRLILPMISFDELFVEMESFLNKELLNNKYIRAFLLSDILAVINGKDLEIRSIKIINKWLLHLSGKDEIDVEEMDCLQKKISSLPKSSVYRFFYQGKLEALLGNFKTAYQLYLEGLDICKDGELLEEIKLHLCDLLYAKRSLENAPNLNILDSIKLLEHFYNAQTQRLEFIRKIIYEVLTKGKHPAPHEFAYSVPEDVFLQILTYYKNKPILTLQLKLEREVSKNKVLEEKLSLSESEKKTLIDRVLSLKNENQSPKENKNNDNVFETELPNGGHGSLGFF